MEEGRMTEESMQAIRNRTQCIVEDVIQSLGYDSLRHEQKAVIIGNHDVFVVGYWFWEIALLLLLTINIWYVIPERYIHCNNNSGESFDSTDEQSNKLNIRPVKFSHVTHRWK